MTDRGQHNVPAPNPPAAAAAAADVGQVVDVFRFGLADPVAVSVPVEG